MKDRPICPDCGSDQLERMFRKTGIDIPVEAKFTEVGEFKHCTDTHSEDIHLDVAKGFMCLDCEAQFDQPKPEGGFCPYEHPAAPPPDEIWHDLPFSDDTPDELDAARADLDKIGGLEEARLKLEDLQKIAEPSKAARYKIAVLASVIRAEGQGGK